MKVNLVLTIQRVIEAANDNDADAKITAIKQQFERNGWEVEVLDDSDLEESSGGKDGEDSEDGGEEE